MPWLRYRIEIALMLATTREPPECCNEVPGLALYLGVLIDQIGGIQAH